MRRCRGCYQNTALHTACTVHRAVIAGGTVERRRYDPMAVARCAGCNTIQGGYHHVGCTDEPCPRCGNLPQACRCKAMATKHVPLVHADGMVAEAPYEIEFGRE